MLKYSVGSASTSIVNKRSVQYQAIGSGSYSGTSGVKTINFHLASAQDYLMPDSMGLKFRMRNKDATNACVLQGSVNLAFSRLRVSVNSVLCEDIAPYGRCIEMLNCLKCAFNAEDREIGSGDKTTSIAATESEVFTLPLSCGLANCGRLIPLKFVPIYIALDLESTLAYVASHEFELLDVVLMANVVELDGSVQDSIAKHILSSGKGIPIKIETLSTPTQAINATTGDATINVSKACSRLNALFITIASNSSSDNLQKALRRPATASQAYEMQVAVGSRNFPENGLKSYPEMVCALSELVGLQVDPVNREIDITRKQCIVQGSGDERRHIVGRSMNKGRNSDFSGLSMRSGEVLSLTLKSAAGVDRCYVTMSYDVILNITGETTEVLA